VELHYQATTVNLFLRHSLASRVRVTYSLKADQSGSTYLPAGACSHTPAGEGLRGARPVASSWKLNLHLSLQESAEYCLPRRGTSGYRVRKSLEEEELMMS
jgi:hypothetical protein